MIELASRPAQNDTLGNGKARTTRSTSAEKPAGAREEIVIAIGSCIFQRSRHLLDRMFVRPFDVGARTFPSVRALRKAARGRTRASVCSNKWRE